MPVLTFQRPLAPAYPDWPEEPQRNVNVLCEGPSIMRLRRRDFLIGPTVAINHALALSSNYQIDFWATVDEPKNLWEWAQPHLPAAAKLFTTANNILFWEDTIQEHGVNERLYAKDPTYMVETEDHPAFLEENGRPALIPSLIHVLGWLGQLPGVERVRIFGCDMVGSGGPLGFEPFSEEEDLGWQRRWQHERTMLALCAREYRKRNRRLERWAPVRSSSKSK